MSRATLLWFFLSFLPAIAQIAPLSPVSRTIRLHWDWRRSQELSWQQSIGRTENLSRTERERLLAALTDQLSDYDFHSEEERKKALVEARVKYVTLDSRGSEVVIQAGDSILCTPTGNCAFWILRRDGNSYVPLLEAEAQTFTLQPTRNRGFRDIVLTRHGSAFESEVKVYRFDGESYKEGDCYSAEWELLGADGKFHKLEAPKLTPCGAR